MHLICGIHNLKPRHKNCVATIGNFDGVHLGHQAVIRQLAEKAAELQLPATVIIFEPQPQEFFGQSKAPARLTRLREKFETLSQFPLETILVLRFNQHFARQSPEEFIRKILVEGVGVRHLVVGDDFRFGNNRSGDFHSLVDAGQHYGFAVENTHSFEVQQKRVSSTLIRECLAAGDFKMACAYLGRNYHMSGRVAHGQKRGRTIGFPTANIFLKRLVTPLSGVFAVKLHGLEIGPVCGVANLGSRPTVDGVRVLLEVHLFDFDQMIYGRHVQIEFIKKLRDEVKFDSFDALKQQIKLDVINAKQCFEIKSEG